MKTLGHSYGEKRMKRTLPLYGYFFRNRAVLVYIVSFFLPICRHGDNRSSVDTCANASQGQGTWRKVSCPTGKQQIHKLLFRRIWKVIRRIRRSSRRTVTGRTRKVPAVIIHGEDSFLRIICNHTSAHRERRPLVTPGNHGRRVLTEVEISPRWTRVFRCN